MTKSLASAVISSLAAQSQSVLSAVRVYTCVSGDVSSDRVTGDDTDTCEERAEASTRTTPGFVYHYHGLEAAPVVAASGFRVWGLGFTVWGLWFRV